MEVTALPPAGVEGIAPVVGAIAQTRLSIAAVELPLLAAATPLDRRAVTAGLAELPTGLAVLPIAPAGDQLSADLIDQIRRIADEAAQQSIQLALEVRSRGPFDGRAILAALRAVDCEGVGVCFDPGNYIAANPTSDAQVALQRCLSHVLAIRLHDHGGNPGDPYETVAGSGGVVDFAGILQTLRAFEFAGPAIVDLRQPEGRGLPGGTAFFDALDASLAHLRMCGWLDGR